MTSTTKKFLLGATYVTAMAYFVGTFYTSQKEYERLERIAEISNSVKASKKTAEISVNKYENELNSIQKFHPKNVGPYIASKYYINNKETLYK